MELTRNRCLGSKDEAVMVLQPDPFGVTPSEKMRNLTLILSMLCGFILGSEAAPLSVRIHSPHDGATFKSVRGVGISALAFGNSPVTKVEFYNGHTLAATDTDAPYNFAWYLSPVLNGRHTWTARAYDSFGNAATSSPVVINVEVETPEITIAQGQRSAGAPATIVLRKGGTHSFRVRNSGSGTLNYAVYAGAPWLTISPTNGASIEKRNLHTITIANSTLRGPTNTLITVLPIGSDAGERIIVQVAPDEPAAPQAPRALRVVR